MVIISVDAFRKSCVLEPVSPSGTFVYFVDSFAKNVIVEL